MNIANSTSVPACAFSHQGAGMTGIGRALRAVLRIFRRPARRPFLDVRTLSDHLKRDIGALDGNDPRGPRR